MNDLLVGSTGFVGGNLKKTHAFSMECHSTNVDRFYSTEPDLCVYAGVPSSMVLSNNNPSADLSVVAEARNNIRKIKPRKLVLISTVAVYGNRVDADETRIPSLDNLSPYGANRLLLENWIRSDYETALIVRLPALYGWGLKKNFLYDLHYIVPQMLKEDKFYDLRYQTELVEKGYSRSNDGFYILNGFVEYEKLRKFFLNNEFNALSFTDSRSKYQYYNLTRLWNDISMAIENNIDLLNITSEPVSAREIYHTVTNRDDWNNEIVSTPFDYNVKSIYSELFGGENGYFISKSEELNDIKEFMTNWK